MNITHHAQLYFVSDSTETPFDIVALQAVSEVTVFQTDTFSINEARTLIDAAYVRPFEKMTRTIIVRANAIGLEAQHALLKVLEEPPLTTCFILIMRQGSVLLPTVLSRLHLMTTHGVTTFVESFAFNTFLAASVSDRISQIAIATKNKDTETLGSLYTGLAAWLVRANASSVGGRSRLLWCESMLTLHGASKKMLWEEIALSLPVAKRGS